MNLIAKVSLLTRDPVLGRYVLQSKLHPRSLLERQSRLAAAAGFRRPVFLLSFDCDTDFDIEVVEDVHRRLRDLGITPVYAVPGQLLERGRAVYRRIAETGAEFINHGHAEHTKLDKASRVYTSFFFYDHLSRDQVREDIRRGDRAIREVLGVEPRGFRAPHFGSVQAIDALEFIYGVLRDLGYEFSSTTIPLYGLRYGPAFDRFGIREVPVSGCFDWPLRILDTWSFRFDATSREGVSDYLRQIERFAEFMAGSNRPFVLNIYADPSQVYDWPAFFGAMGLFARFSVSSYLSLARPS